MWEGALSDTRWASSVRGIEMGVPELIGGIGRDAEGCMQCRKARTRVNLAYKTFVRTDRTWNFQSTSDSGYTGSEPRGLCPGFSPGDGRHAHPR